MSGDDKDVAKNNQRDPNLRAATVARVNQLVKGGLTKAAHLASLNQRHESTDVCLRCGGRMVARTAKASGKQFLGCSNFPKCRHTIWPKG